MKNQLLTIAFIFITILFSCKKEDTLTKNIKPAETTGEIIAKAGFKWENSRNINFTINVLNPQYPKLIHVISIYDGDPTLNGSLISKGSATTLEAFKSKVYLPNQFVEVYVVANFPNGSKITKKLLINNADLSLTIGL